MLDPHYLEHITDGFMEHYDKAILTIIQDAARRIAKAGEVTKTVSWEIAKLEQMGAYHDVVLSELLKAAKLSEGELLKLFDNAGKRALEFDDKIYKAAGYEPVPLKDNAFMQNILWSSYERTGGTFKNLTRTTANTATRQFENILDDAHFRLSSGAFTYQQVIKWGIKSLTDKGIASIEYHRHADYADVAFRRATLTGLNQAGLKLQERRLEEMGADYVETTAHAGARPDHQEWQGCVFKLTGSTDEYPNFYEATGYGTGGGLGGWNCRHGFYPFYPGISETANTRQYLEELNNTTVSYNGETLTLYGATQVQRNNERHIRKWKREHAGLEAAGLDSSEATANIRKWQARQRDLIGQTGLTRDYFRERAGKQNA